METKYLIAIVGLPLALMAFVCRAAGESEATLVAEAAVTPAAAAPADSVGPIEVTPEDKPADATQDDDIKIETLPDGTVIIPAGRPEWVRNPKPRLIGNVYTVPVTSGPHPMARLAQQALDAALVEATNEFIADHLGSKLAPTLVGNYDAAAIKRQFVRPANTYDEVITVSIGDMNQSHALLEFGPEFQARLQSQWAQVRATSRLTQLGLFAGASLLLLGSVFGYFRLDNATRGYYTGRLQFLAAAAILAIIGAGALLGRWITWM
jgi:hypothetical protein